jgi:hypothetical protein
MGRRREGEKKIWDGPALFIICGWMRGETNLL